MGATPPGPGADQALAQAERVLVRAISSLDVLKADASGVRAHAELTLRLLHPVPVGFLVRAAESQLLRLVDRTARGGWGPGDLGELVRRRGGAACVGALAGLLTDYARREAWAREAWARELAGLGPARVPELRTVDGLAIALQVAALLAVVPTVEGALPATVPDAAHPKLARVRALLAKAESTEYDEEAEALSAKAQELIARYSLERLLQRGAATGAQAGPGVTSRRLWLDAPYVMAKATLVHEVAGANRCRAVVTDSLGFCLVVGDPGDVDAVEVLVTSLLVQASSALVRHGRNLDRRGASRTRSFRHAFLIAYAHRIGDRLRAAGEEAVAEAGGHARLLPVLRDQETLVEEALQAMVPHRSTKATTVSNHEGWVAGRAAADLAMLDVRPPITPRR